MIDFSHAFSTGLVFVTCSTNAEEEKQLETLAKEVAIICKMTEKTGLWVVAEFQVGLKKALATSLGKKLEISDADIAVLQAEVTKRLQGDRNA